IERREGRLPPHGAALEGHIPGQGGEGADGAESAAGGAEDRDGAIGACGSRGRREARNRRRPGRAAEDPLHEREDRVAGVVDDPPVPGGEDEQGDRREKQEIAEAPLSSRPAAEDPDADRGDEEEPQVLDVRRAGGEDGGEDEPGALSLVLRPAPGAVEGGGAGEAAAARGNRPPSPGNEEGGRQKRREELDEVGRDVAGEQQADGEEGLVELGKDREAEVGEEGQPAAGGVGPRE